MSDSGEREERRVQNQDPASEALRQQAIDTLCEAFADDRMSLADFEQRVELAHRSSTTNELRALLQGLPEAPVPQRTASTQTSPARHRPSAPDRVSKRNLIMGILGGGSRRGSWTPADTNLAIALMGGVELDLRDARLRPGEVTEIDCFALFAGIEIIAPPDVHIECSGIGLLGGFDHNQADEQNLDVDAPTIRINGVAMFGGVEVTIRHPGESKRDAKRRRRADRHGRRLLDRGGRDD